jgi:hypothetical protein
MKTVELKKLNPLYLSALHNGDEEEGVGTEDQNLDEKELGENMDEDGLAVDDLDNEFIEESDEEV